MDRKELADGYFISTDKKQLQTDVIHKYLSEESYWAKGIPPDVVERGIRHSYCFGIYKEEEQVGFARVVTDYVRFAWLADVFVLKAHRGKGLSKDLMSFILSQPELQNLNWTLGTLDAHGLYNQFGFTSLTRAERMMELRNHRGWEQNRE